MIKRTILVSSPSHLSLRNGQMIVKMAELERCDKVDERFKREFERSVPIEDIGMLMVENRQVTLTAGLLAALAAANSAVAVCDDRMMPTGLMLPLAANTTLTERMRKQVEASLPLKKQMWQQTVRAKIANQAKVLSHATGESHPCMTEWAADVRSGDADNTEGRAAAYYWKNLFTGRIGGGFRREPDGEWPNAMLNYGYAVVRAVVARALVGSGLSPTLGIFHRNKYNAYCLADDIMEPYRPVVDMLVLRLMERDDCQDGLSKEAKRELMQLPQADVRMEGKTSPLMNAVAVTSASVSACFCGDERKISYPEIIC